MNSRPVIIYIFILVGIVLSLTQCSESLVVQKTSPFGFGASYSKDLWDDNIEEDEKTNLLLNSTKQAKFFGYDAESWFALNGSSNELVLFSFWIGNDPEAQSVSTILEHMESSLAEYNPETTVESVDGMDVYFIKTNMGDALIYKMFFSLSDQPLLVVDLYSHSDIESSNYQKYAELIDSITYVR